MSFLTDPSGSLYSAKQDSASPPTGKFNAADANQIRTALLELGSVMNGTGSIPGPLLISGSIHSYIEVSGTGAGMVMSSPNGTKFIVTVTDGGALVTTPV